MTPALEREATIVAMARALQIVDDVQSTSDRIAAYTLAGIPGERIIMHDDQAMRRETLRRQLAAINANPSGKVNYK